MVTGRCHILEKHQCQHKITMCIDDSVLMFMMFMFCLPALPLQTESPSIQNGDKCLGKDALTSDDSAITDLSPKTESSPQTETPTQTDASSKTEMRPSTPGSSPQPKKGGVLNVSVISYLS